MSILLHSFLRLERYIISSFFKNVVTLATSDILYLFRVALLVWRNTSVITDFLLKAFDRLFARTGYLGLYEPQPPLIECLMDISDVYVLDSLSLEDVDLRAIEGTEAPELRVTRSMDIGGGIELEWARWIRAWCLLLTRTLDACQNFYFHALSKFMSPVNYEALVSSILMSLGSQYTKTALTLLKITIIMRWFNILWFTVVQMLVHLWTAIFISLDRGLCSPGPMIKLLLRAVNAFNVVLAGFELNVTRPSNQIVDTKTLEEEFARLGECATKFEVPLLQIRLSATLSKAVTMPYDLFPHWLRTRVETMVRSASSHKRLANAKGERAHGALNAMQIVMDSQDTSRDLKDSVHPVMIQLSTTSIAVPRRLVLQNVQFIGSKPITSGGFGDIYRGSYGKLDVCVKVPKLAETSDRGRERERMLGDLAREAVLWSRLEHPNVLPFYGENGNICEYLARNSETPRLPLIFGIMAGLQYLHENKVVHGDLKGANILISTSGSPRLVDFGISSIVDVCAPGGESMPAVTRVGGTMQWMAPELQDPSASGTLAPTASSDVYSLASVMYEVLTDQTPFYDVPDKVDLIHKLVKKILPTKPLSFKGLELSNELWEIMEGCWNSAPEGRPTIQQVMEDLRKFIPTVGLTTLRVFNQARTTVMLGEDTAQQVVHASASATKNPTLNLLDEFMFRDLELPRTSTEAPSPT